ncbi:PAS domain-containing protein, partial [Eggerthella lenta]|nr:PAS domain-containing protein [Eggerthella lenta]
MSAEIEILLQSMPYAILLWDNNGKILNANRKFEEYFRLPREEVIGQDYDEWLAGAFEEQRFINSEGYVEARASHGD